MIFFIFFCTGCGNRFTHANRHCPNHPFSRLKREEPKEGQGKAQSVDNKAVAEWLAKSVNTTYTHKVLNKLSCWGFFSNFHSIVLPLTTVLCVCAGTGKPASSVRPPPPRPNRRTRREKKTRSSRIPWSSSSRTRRRRRPWRKRRAARLEVPPSDASRSSGSVSTALWLWSSWPTTCRPERAPFPGPSSPYLQSHTAFLSLRAVARNCS